MKRLGIIIILLGILMGSLCLGVRWAKKERLPEGEGIEGITCRRIRALAIDKKETLWIGTDEGLLSFDGKRWKLFDIVNSSIPDNNITSIFIDRDNNKWITTHTKGIGKFDGQQWEIYNTTNSGLVENSVKTILQDKNGNMWFLTWRITRFNGEEWITYTEEDGFTARNLNSMVQDHKGNIWVSTRYSNIFRYDGNKWIGYKKEELGLPKRITVRMYDVDKDGRIWCSIKPPRETYRLVIFDSEKFFELDLKGSGLTKDSQITRVYIDPGDNKWIAYESKYGGGGVSGAVKFNGTKWTSYATGTPLEKQRIEAMIMDREGNMWFGTLDKGLLKFDGKEWITFEAIDIVKKRMWWRHAERDKIDSMSAIEVSLKELRRKPRKYYGKKVRTTGYYYSGYLSVKKIPDIGIGIEFKVKDEDKQYISPRKMTVEGFFEFGSYYRYWGKCPYSLFVTDIIPTKKS